MRQAPSVLIIDDHPLFRDALEAALHNAFADGANPSHAGSLEDALRLMQDQVFDLLLLDLNLSDVSGFAGLARLKSDHPAIPIAIVSATETADAYQKAKTLGSLGYLPKSMAMDDLSAALVTILDGGVWFPAEMADAETGDLDMRLTSLTPAQRKVLSGLSDGLLNKQIAFNMGISIATVKAHLTAIFRKLGANNRTQALLIYKDAVSLQSDHLL